MWKNAYFGYHYQPNPNLIVVPIMSSTSPHSGKKQIVDPKTSTLKGPSEQITPVADNIGDDNNAALACRLNCNQQNLPVVSPINTSFQTENSDNLTNSLHVLKGKISNEAPESKKSQSIQDVSTSTLELKPHHNLFDLNGCNITKREIGRDNTNSSLKHKDLVNDSAIEKNDIKIRYDEIDHRHYSNSDFSETDSILKEYSTKGEPTSTNSERNTNFGCGKPKKSKTDMQDQVRKSVKQPWKGKFEKVKAKAVKEKHDKFKKDSSKTKQEYKDAKEESNRGEAYLQKVFNSYSTNDLRNQIIHSKRSKENVSSNPTKDLRNKIMERRSMDNKTSKRKTNSDVSIRDGGSYLSPDSIKRYKDFKRFMRYNDDCETKYSSMDQKSKNLPGKKTHLKSSETKTNNPFSKNEVDEHNKSKKRKIRSQVNTNQTNLKRVENHTDMKREYQNNTDRVKLIKSVVRVEKIFHNNLSQRKRIKSCAPDGVEDLRSKLSRKRGKQEYLGPMKNGPVQEISKKTVNQDAQTDSKNSPIVAPTINKPQLSKGGTEFFTPISVCPSSDSVNSNEDLNESCSSPVDLSFLVDINVDLIIDLLNLRPSDPNVIIDDKHNDQTKPKDDVINDVNMEAIAITEKEETSSHKVEVTEISSNTVENNMNIEIGSDTNTEKCKNKQMNKILKGGKSTKQEKKNETDLTGNSYKENAPKKTIDICKEKQNIKTVSKFYRHTKQEENNETDFNKKYSDHDSVVEEINISDEKEHKISKHIVISSCAKQEVKEKNVYSHISGDTVMLPLTDSLETMSNNCEQNCSIRNNIIQNKINTDGNVKENSIQESLDAVEARLETLFNSTKNQPLNINMNIEQPSSSQNIQKDIDVLQTAQVMTKVETIVDQNKMKTELSGITDKDIKVELATQNPGTQILPEITKNSIAQNEEIKINSKPLNIRNEINPRKSGSKSKNSLETKKNILEKATNKMDIVCRFSKNVKEHVQIFEETDNKPQHKPINKTEQRNYESSKQIDTRPRNIVRQNKKPRGEPLQKSVKSIKIPSKATADNPEQMINISSESNTSDKNIEEKTFALQNFEVKSVKSTERSNIQHKTDVTTSVELTNTDIEVTSWKTLIVKAENLLRANHKETALRTCEIPNSETQTKLESVKNYTLKKETINDACDLNNITIKDSELGKYSDIVTNIKQEQETSNKSLFPGGNKNEEEKISNKQAEISAQPKHNFLSKLETLMSEYLLNKYTFSSVIHKGRFSTIYKCFDTKGEPYAVKVVNHLQRGMHMQGMLCVLRKYRPREDFFVLYLINGLQVENQWCLLTEYYPENLKQALRGYMHGFDINRVQVLSRQLVDAVKMLTNDGIIHSDIKPSHILLNSTHDRLKLCGFDRSNYRSCIKITPSTGTPSYRAPEIILGFQEDHRIDIWSTALVMFQMATNKTLIMGFSNNVILYEQLCTFGSFDYSMLEQSKYGALHFYGSSFLQKIPYSNHEETRVINYLHRNDNLRRLLFQSCEGQRALDRNGNKWQTWKDMQKFERLHRLLEQMLAMDPRNRLPIQFVAANEFMSDEYFRIT